MRGGQVRRQGLRPRIAVPSGQRPCPSPSPMGIDKVTLMTIPRGWNKVKRIKRCWERWGRHLDKVAQSLGGAPGAGVDVLDARHLQHLLGDASGDNAGATRRGDEADQHTAALAGNLRAIGGSVLIRQQDSGSDTSKLFSRSAKRRSQSQAAMTWNLNLNFEIFAAEHSPAASCLVGAVWFRQLRKEQLGLKN